MKSKLIYFETYFKNQSFIACPICKTSIIYDNYILSCESNHTFNVSKKGYSVLINKSNLKKSKIYDKNLFLNRRNFIILNPYQPIYEYIEKIIQEYLKSTKNQINILDLGCGEGGHIELINKDKLNVKTLGIDYSKEAIEIATDYLDENQAFLVADINNLPIMNNSIDIIINILSPFNSLEVKRVLKKGGLFIKVSPLKNYLKEIRESNNLPEYSNYEEVKENIFSNFDIINEKEQKYKFQLNTKIKENLIKMTPLTQSSKSLKINADNITMDLVIYVLKGK